MSYQRQAVRRQKISPNLSSKQTQGIRPPPLSKNLILKTSHQLFSKKGRASVTSKDSEDSRRESRSQRSDTCSIGGTFPSTVGGRSENSSRSKREIGSALSTSSQATFGNPSDTSFCSTSRPNELRNMKISGSEFSKSSTRSDLNFNKQRVPDAKFEPLFNQSLGATPTQLGSPGSAGYKSRRHRHVSDKQPEDEAAEKKVRESALTDLRSQIAQSIRLPRDPAHKSPKISSDETLKSETLTVENTSSSLPSQMPSEGRDLESDSLVLSEDNPVTGGTAESSSRAHKQQAVGSTDSSSLPLSSVIATKGSSASLGDGPNVPSSFDTVSDQVGVSFHLNPQNLQQLPPFGVPIALINQQRLNESGISFPVKVPQTGQGTVIVYRHFPGMGDLAPVSWAARRSPLSVSVEAVHGSTGSLDVSYDDSSFPTEHKLATSEAMREAMKRAKSQSWYTQRPSHALTKAALAQRNKVLNMSSVSCHNSFPKDGRKGLHLKYRDILSRLYKRDFAHWEAEVLARAGMEQEEAPGLEADEDFIPASSEAYMPKGLKILEYNASNVYGRPPKQRQKIAKTNTSSRMLRNAASDTSSDVPKDAPILICAEDETEPSRSSRSKAIRAVTLKNEPSTCSTIPKPSSAGSHEQIYAAHSQEVGRCMPLPKEPICEHESNCACQACSKAAYWLNIDEHASTNRTQDRGDGATQPEQQAEEDTIGTLRREIQVDTNHQTTGEEQSSLQSELGLQGGLNVGETSTVQNEVVPLSEGLSGSGFNTSESSRMNETLSWEDSILGK